VTSEPISVDGEPLTFGFAAGSEICPLFDRFLAAAAEQGALDTIGEYYGVTASFGD
jgi:hypothetical protein